MNEVVIVMADGVQLRTISSTFVPFVETLNGDDERASVWRRYAVRNHDPRQRRVGFRKTLTWTEHVPDPTDHLQTSRCSSHKASFVADECYETRLVASLSTRAARGR